MAVRDGAGAAPDSGEGDGVGAVAAELRDVAGSAAADSGVAPAGGDGAVGSAGAVGVGTDPVAPAPSGAGDASAVPPESAGKAHGNSSSTVTLVNSGDTRMYPATATITANGVPTTATGSQCRHTQRCQPARYPKAPIAATPTTTAATMYHRYGYRSAASLSNSPKNSPIPVSSTPQRSARTLAPPLRDTPRCQLDEFNSRAVRSFSCCDPQAEPGGRRGPVARLALLVASHVVNDIHSRHEWIDSRLVGRSPNDVSVMHPFVRGIPER